MGIISIVNMDNGMYSYYLEIIKENSRSIYAESTFDGAIYRIEKKSKKVYLNGKLYSNTCSYFGDITSEDIKSQIINKRSE